MALPLHTRRSCSAEPIHQPSGNGKGKADKSSGGNASSRQTPCRAMEACSVSSAGGCGEAAAVRATSATSSCGDDHRASHRTMRASTERCEHSTMEDVWSACDVFWEFDPQHTGKITRPQYLSLISQPASVIRLRFMRRSRLEERFRNSAAPVTLEEFLQLLWPGAGQQELKQMRRWSRLREARTIMNDSSFRGSETELKRIFDHLDSRGEGRVSARDVISARLVSCDELRRLLEAEDSSGAGLDLEVFRARVWPHLMTAFISPEVAVKLKEKEEDAMFESTFRRSLRAARCAPETAGRS